MIITRNGVLAMDASWEEGKHKRADNGQFGSGGGGASSSGPVVKGGAPAKKSGASGGKKA